MEKNEEKEERAGENTLTCSICESPVALAHEGGIQGFFGMLPVAFCVWCYTSMEDMVSQQCLRCQEDEETGIGPSIN